MEQEAAPTATLGHFGIDEAGMWLWFGRVAAAKQPGPRYTRDNPNFPLADALALYTMLEHFRPKRFIEVGSGYSSFAALDAVEHLGLDTSLTFIEPHPPDFLASDPRLLVSRLQSVPTSTFEELESGDILFIDSSHVAKTGSDVVDYLFRIFPALKPGVVVHIHDIFFPFEYPRAWIADQNRSWNEAYFLRAFLHANPNWQVLFLFDWFYKCRRDALAAAMPECIEHRGGSLWLRHSPSPETT
jgi:predicted O-methyltransferase YrrM